MGTRMRWERARVFDGFEEKYKPGVLKKNGRVVYSTPRDSLEARAKAAERLWLKANGLSDVLGKR